MAWSTVTGTVPRPEVPRAEKGWEEMDGERKAGLAPGPSEGTPPASWEQPGMWAGDGRLP